MSNSIYTSRLRGHNKQHQQDTISTLKTDFKLIISKDDNPIKSLYKLFFRSLALIHLELEETAIEVKTENDDHHNKYVYHLSSEDQQKHDKISQLIKLQNQIHAFALSYTDNLDQQDDQKPIKQPEFRSLKPIQILESFHPDTQIYINIGAAKSVRKTGFTSYKEMLQYSKEVESLGRDRILNSEIDHDKNYLIDDFVKCHNNFRRIIQELKNTDPKQQLIKHFRIILEAHSYRVRYIDSANNETTSNICNGVILLNSPVKAIVPNKPARKKRNDKKINLPIYLPKVFASSSVTDANIHFCLSDVEGFPVKDKLEEIFRQE